MKNLSFLLIFISVLAQANEFNDSSAIRLSDVEVNAYRQQQFSTIGQVVKKIDAEEIHRLPAQSIDVLLKSISGVDIRQRGAGGTQSDISLRGGSFDQVLILLNGVNITDPQTGHHHLDIPLDLSEVSSVEVLQGSASRRYGSQAFSGAINIVTDATSKSLIDASLSYGYYNTQFQKITVGLGKKKLRHFTSFSHNSSDGYRSNTDYNNDQLFSQTNWQTKHSGTFDFQLAAQRKSFGANGFYSLAYPDQFEHTETQFSSLSWHQQWKKLNVNAQAYYRRHYDRFELFRDFENAASWYVDHNYHLTDVGGGAINTQYFASFGKLSGGLELKYDHIFSTVLGKNILEVIDQPKNTFEKDKFFTKEDQRLVKSGYVDFSKSSDKVFSSIGASFSQTTAFGFQTHVGADVSYFLTNDFVVYASANTASRLPTFTDLYYQSATQKANPDLKPEHSATLEAGFKYNAATLQFNGGGFYRRGTNIIDWIKFPTEEKWESMNLTTLNTFGAEGSIAYAFSKGWLKNLKLAYAFVHTDKAPTEFDSKYALDYLRHQLIFQASHAVLRHLTMTWNASYNDRAGGYADFSSGNQVTYQPYLLISNRIAWQLKQFVIFADLNNLLNLSYVDFGGLPQPGFHAMLGIKCNI